MPPYLIVIVGTSYCHKHIELGHPVETAVGSVVVLVAFDMLVFPGDVRFLYLVSDCQDHTSVRGFRIDMRVPVHRLV